ncbi:MAG TPA: L,D-transpeptidase family protein [Bryobacteraceae bacterium]
MGPKSICWLAPALAALAYFCVFPERAQNKSLPRPMDEYERTLVALERYRLLAAQDEGTLLPETAQPVEAGDSYEGVPRLIRLLTLIGDLPADAVLADSGVYDGPLVAAVERFQVRHGLEPDGRIDQATLTQLNTPLAFRVHQLELALERWRRRPYDPGRPVIVLNLPEFRLRAFRGNRLELEMKIVDGQPPDRRTPLLSSELETIVFRPYWNVPVSITRDELIQEIVKDPSFLRDNHLDMVGLRGDVVEGAASDEMLARLRTGALKLRQAPGPKNVLGLVKFEFPNSYGIYMHATSAPWLFSQARRDLSHGCIRVENAEDLAEWALRDEPGWPRDRIEDAMQGSEPVAVRLKRPIQLVTIYVTAMALENGEVRFFDDIYGEDEALEKELTQRAARSVSRGKLSVRLSGDP